MKTIKTTIAIAAIALFSFNSIAGLGDIKPTVKNLKTFDVAIYQSQNSLKMNLNVEKLVGQKLHISLINQKGEVLHQEFIAKNEISYARKFDFSELEDGQYSFEISNGTTTEVKIMKIESIKKESEKVISIK